MEKPGSITLYEERRAKGTRVPGISYILIFTSGIVDILALSRLWPLLAINGLLSDYGWKRGALANNCMALMAKQGGMVSSGD